MRNARLCLLALLVAGQALAAEPPLGRLFFTPERRAALERQRQLNIQEDQALEGSTVSLNGVVVRSSGRNTVWVNQQAQPERSVATGVAVRVERNGKAVVTADGEAPAELRVGESLNRATREKDNGIGGGTVAVKPVR
jgi:hypothetical protein